MTDVQTEIRIAEMRNARERGEELYELRRRGFVAVCRLGLEDLRHLVRTLESLPSLSPADRHAVASYVSALAEWPDTAPSSRDGDEERR